MRKLAALVSLAFATTALGADPAALAAPAPASGALPAQLAPAPVPTSRAGYGKTSGVIPGIVIGPKLSLFSVPGPVGIGLEAKALDGLLGLGLDYSFFPTLKMGEVEAGYNDVSLAARIFPWQGRFYVGAALGSRKFFARATDSFTSERIEVEVKSTYLAPEIGWRFVWDAGFFMGIDLGYQIVLSPDTTLTLPPGGDAVVNAQDKKDVEDIGDEIGKVGLPIVSLVQLGWYF